MALVFDNSTNTITDDTGAAPILGTTGAAGDVLTSNGAVPAPTMQTPAGGAVQLVASTSLVYPAGASFIDFTGLDFQANKAYMLVMDGVLGSTPSSFLCLRTSLDNGISFTTTGYGYAIGIQRPNAAAYTSFTDGSGSSIRAELFMSQQSTLTKEFTFSGNGTASDNTNAYQNGAAFLVGISTQVAMPMR